MVTLSRNHRSGSPRNLMIYVARDVTGAVNSKLKSLTTNLTETPMTTTNMDLSALLTKCGFQKYRTAITLIPGQPFQ